MLGSQIFHNRYTLSIHISYHMQISKSFWTLAVDLQAGYPKDKKIKLDLFQVSQQAMDRGLPDSQACDTDRRPVTLLKYSNEGYLVQLRVFACITGELFNLPVESLLNWSCMTYQEMPKGYGTAILRWDTQEHAWTFSSINSPIWCEASICESSITPLARPIGILHSKESKVSLLLKKSRDIPIYILVESSETTSFRTILSNTVTSSLSPQRRPS